LSGVLGARIDRSFNNNSLDPAVRDRIRKVWNLEKQEHQRAIEQACEQEKQWKEKMDEWSEKQDEWRRKAQELQRKLSEMERRAREVVETVDIEKEKWEREHVKPYWEDHIKGEESSIPRSTKKHSAHLANLPGIAAHEAPKATPLTIPDVVNDPALPCKDRVSNMSRFESNKAHTQWQYSAIFSGWYSWSLDR
jgi:hypothetical protein